MFKAGARAFSESQKGFRGKEGSCGRDFDKGPLGSNKFCKSRKKKFLTPRKVD
ncbi:hypothetical protein PV326_000671, partial [Microctonus aethiopoides]